MKARRAASPSPRPHRRGFCCSPYDEWGIQSGTPRARHSPIGGEIAAHSADRASKLCAYASRQAGEILGVSSRAVRRMRLPLVAVNRIPNSWVAARGDERSQPSPPPSRGAASRGAIPAAGHEPVLPSALAAVRNQRHLSADPVRTL